MAEIKSTMEKVMERLATMGPVSGQEIDADEILKQGMRFAAQYMRGEINEFQTALAESQEAKRALLLKGIAQVLLRNIVLPRDADQQDAEKGMQGLLELGKGNRELLEVLGETKKILDRFLEHKQQLRQQLESAIRQQLEQAMAQQGIPNNLPIKIDPSMHPKYQEEWGRIQNELQEQYSRALNQYKEAVVNILGV
jgi:hypothetical protein